MIQSLMSNICADFNYQIQNDLIQNTEPISITEAQEIEPAAALRWRYRVCRISGTTFDITKEGLFYTCGKALES